jgi:hypothetical protein
MSGDERGQHAPRRGARPVRTDETQDLDARGRVRRNEDSLVPPVTMQALSRAARAELGPVAVRIPEAALVLAQIVDVGGDKGATSEAPAA